jgi:hypothetical protein
MKKQITLKIPREMQLLCSMAEIEPETVLQSFANDLSIASERLDENDRRKMATNYLLRCTEDNELYKKHQVDVFFKELNELLDKWPNDKECFKEFFKKWPGKWRRMRKR